MDEWMGEQMDEGVVVWGGVEKGINGWMEDGPIDV